MNDINEGSIKVSIIVPVYNVELYLGECLDSLKNQTMKEVEVLIIDDGSRDSSKKIADEYAEHDTRFRVICQSNGGPAAARNIGIKLAKGEYIAFVDSDDWVRLDAFERLYEDAKIYDADIVVGNIFYCTEKNGAYRKRKEDAVLARGQIIDGKDYWTRVVRKETYLSVVYMNLYRSSLIWENDLYFKPYFYHEDEYFTPYAFYYAQRVVNSGETFYYYRQREGSIMHSADRKKRAECIFQIADYFFEFAEKNKEGGDIPPVIVTFLLRAIILYVRAFENYICLLQTENTTLNLPPIKCFKLKLWLKYLNDADYKQLNKWYIYLMNQQKQLMCLMQSEERNLLK